MRCFLCHKNFEDIYVNSINCYVCEKVLCFQCNQMHKHNYFNSKLNNIYGFSYFQIDEGIEELFDKYRDLLHNMRKTFWENNDPEYRYILNFNGDFRFHCAERYMIKERFMYKLVQMFLREKFCNDIVEVILMYI